MVEYTQAVFSEGKHGPHFNGAGEQGLLCLGKFVAAVANGLRDAGEQQFSELTLEYFALLGGVCLELFKLVEDQQKLAFIAALLLLEALPEAVFGAEGIQKSHFRRIVR